MNVMHLNHPETIPHGKIVFHETSPWYQKVGDHCSTRMLSSNLGPTSAPLSAPSAPSVLAGTIDVLRPDGQSGRNAANGVWQRGLSLPPLTCQVSGAKCRTRLSTKSKGSGSLRTSDLHRLLL